MAIPLFKFPILVIKLVFEVMGFMDLFLLTNASSRTKRLVKNLLTVRNHEMLISRDQEEFCIVFQRDSKTRSFERVHSQTERSLLKDPFYLKFGTIDQVPSKSYLAPHGAYLTIFWNPNIFEKVYNAFSEFFKLPTNEMVLDVNGVAFDTYRKWVNWINTALVPSLIIIKGKCSFSNYLWILRNVKTGDWIRFQMEPIDYPNNTENIEIPNFGASTIVITYGKWINMKQLQSIKADNIYIWRVSFTDTQINAFLKSLKTSETASNWKLLKLLFDREGDPEVVTEGIDATNEDHIKIYGRNQYSFMMGNGKKCTMMYAVYKGEHEGTIQYGFEFHV